MAKVNRNAPCPCSSGKKYKRCCLPQDREAAAAQVDRQAREAGSALLPLVALDDNIDELSNRVVDLIADGRLDEAEEACRELKREFPDAIDWIERTGALHEARGEHHEAIAYYRRCLDYIEQHPDYFEEASKDWYRRAITRLESGAEPSVG